MKTVLLVGVCVALYCGGNPPPAGAADLSYNKAGTIWPHINFDDPAQWPQNADEKEIVKATVRVLKDIDCRTRTGMMLGYFQQPTPADKASYLNLVIMESMYYHALTGQEADTKYYAHYENEFCDQNPYASIQQFIQWYAESIHQ